MDKKEIRGKIRELRKIKKKLKTLGGRAIKCPTRNKINRQIRELKRELNSIYGEVSPEKEILIRKILKTKEYHIDLRKFSVNELKKHLKLLGEKGIINE